MLILQPRHIDRKLRPWLNTRFIIETLCCILFSGRISIQLLVFSFSFLLQLMEELECEAKEKEAAEDDNGDSMK
jgi:hypothetical protein